MFDSLQRCIQDEVAIVLVTIVSGPSCVGNKMLVYSDGSTEGAFANDGLADQTSVDALRYLTEELSRTQSYSVHDETFEVFFAVFPVPSQIIIVGATDTAIALSRMGRSLGYRIIVTDARAAFAQESRFPDADRVLKGWPQDVLPSLRFDSDTYVVLLSHDPKFDEPTLHHVLPTNARYIGAIGSRKTQAERFERLRLRGSTDEQLSRVYGPVGLDIGGKTADETALAILAEITAVRYGRSGGFMRERKVQ